MRKGMFVSGIFLFIFSGFWSYEFYSLYQDLTTLGGFFTLAFSSSRPLSFSIMNAVGFQYWTYQQAVNVVEIVSIMCIAFTIIGLVAFVVGASAKPKEKKTN